MKSALMIAALMLAMIVGQAKADVETVTTQVQNANLANDDGDGLGFLINLTPFDSSLGTLNSVNVLLSGSAFGSVGIDIPTPTCADTPSATAYPVLSGRAFGISEAFKLNPLSVAVNSRCGYRWFDMFSVQMTDLPPILIDPQLFLSADAFAYFPDGKPDAGDGPEPTTGDFSITVQYEYTAVPEPVSLAVFGLGLLCLGFEQSRKNRLFS